MGAKAEAQTSQEVPEIHQAGDNGGLDQRACAGGAEGSPGHQSIWPEQLGRSVHLRGASEEAVGRPSPMFRGEAQAGEAVSSETNQGTKKVCGLWGYQTLGNHMLLSST